MHPSIHRMDHTVMMASHYQDVCNQVTQTVNCPRYRGDLVQAARIQTIFCDANFPGISCVYTYITCTSRVIERSSLQFGSVYFGIRARNISLFNRITNQYWVWNIGAFVEITNCLQVRKYHLSRRVAIPESVLLQPYHGYLTKMTRSGNEFALFVQECLTQLSE